MSLPTKTQQTLDRAVQALTGQFRENLYSCILFGSAVRGGFVEGKSDLNLLIVLNESTAEAHQALGDILKESPEISPMIIGKDSMEGDFLSFANKFQSIRRNYKVLHGADPLVSFQPDESLLRVFCEQSLRNLRLRLTHAFVKSRKDRKSYLRYLSKVTPSVFVNLSDVLRLGGIQVPTSFPERIQTLAGTFDADASVLNELLKLSQSNERKSEEEIFSIHLRIHRLLSQTLHWMESQWPKRRPNLPT